jgi:hypothetical protein
MAHSPLNFLLQIHYRFTPALTLRGLFMQFLTFFSSERVSRSILL